MTCRRFPVLALVLTVLTAPVAALVCETRCGSGASTEATASPVTENGDCHGARETRPRGGSRLTSPHDCAQHTALPVIPSLKSDSTREIVGHGAVLSVGRVADAIHFFATGEVLSQHDLAPPGSGPRLIAPLRI